MLLYSVSLLLFVAVFTPQAPHVGSAMRHILHKAQSKTGFWVGSSVVHLGDHNVPNALMFIDKYTQVPRILNPIVVVLRALDVTSDMMKNPDTVKCVCSSGVARPAPHCFSGVSMMFCRFVNDAFGGPEAARKLILSDFFRHAFDGSGADNFFDAGSCIGASAAIVPVNVLLSRVCV